MNGYLQTVFHSLASTAKLDKALGANLKLKQHRRRDQQLQAVANKDKASAISATRVHSWLPDSAIVVTVSDPSIERLKEAIEDMVNEAKAYWAARRRLGVLFHERLRIRPTNEVFGEAILQVGTYAWRRSTDPTIRRDPSEEQLSAKSAIWRCERNTSFSSTWSTDMANTIASQQSSQQSTNIGAGVGVVPDGPHLIKRQCGRQCIGGPWQQ
jgi:C4-dicarboxylate-specific signal transduction histidine kinase